MKKLYEKNEVLFACLWIALYVFLFSAADNGSRALGTEKILTAPLCVLMTAFLAVWITKNGLAEKYGLTRGKADGRQYLYFLPLILIPTVNLWGGLTMRFSLPETVLYVVSMLCVGFLEEIIFRGFLFRALCREHVKRAILISSVTFGLGHIVNLLNGAPVFSTLLQICYAVAIGFLFTILFYKSKTLLPCIAAHSAVNTLSAFAVEQGGGYSIAGSVFLILVSLGYAAWILKRVK